MSNLEEETIDNGCGVRRVSHHHELEDVEDLKTKCASLFPPVN
jgi:hypothetical protein